MGGTPPVGVVLAGGRGRRLGGDKAIVELEGRALVHYPVEALHSVCDDVVVVAKRDTLLPSLSGSAGLWIEPDEPRHPLVGVAHALGLAAGRAVLVVAVDLPLVDAAVLRAILAAEIGPPTPDATVVAPYAYGSLQPFCALYRPEALAAGLKDFDPSARTIEVVEALGVRVVEGLDETAFFNVNAPEDVLRASVLIRGASPR